MFNYGKLGFQFKTYIKNYLYIVFIGIMYGFIEGIANTNVSRELNFNTGNYYNQENQVILYIVFAFFIMSVGFERLYKETANYFVSIGFTRKRYYEGNIIAVVLVSLLTSLVCCITFFVSFKLDGDYRNYKFIQCFGYKVLALNGMTTIEIIILITAVYIAIYMLANLLGILYMKLKVRGKRIVLIINIIVFSLVGFATIYYPVEVNYVFKNFINVSNNYVGYVMFLIALSILIYILSENLFMKIDIKDK